RHQEVYAARQGRLRQVGLHEAHPVEPELPRALLGPLPQVLPRLHAPDRLPRFRLAQEQLVQDEREIGIARARIDERRLRMALAYVEQGRLQELDQVVDLLQLAQRVGVHRAVAAEQVQLAEQLRGLTGKQLAPDRLASGLPRGHGARQYGPCMAREHAKWTCSRHAPQGWSPSSGPS